MTTITLSTTINAPLEKVFDLSRSIDFHQESASQTQEKAIAGVTTGLISKGETVTWEGKHFGLWFTHKSLITEMTPPMSFTDEMTQGHFKSFKHIHHFTNVDSSPTPTTLMTDHLTYELPGGWLGKLIDKLLIHKHLTHFLLTRNNHLKQQLEY